MPGNTRLRRRANRTPLSVDLLSSTPEPPMEIVTNGAFIERKTEESMAEEQALAALEVAVANLSKEMKSLVGTVHRQTTRLQRHTERLAIFSSTTAQIQSSMAEIHHSLARLEQQRSEHHLRSSTNSASIIIPSSHFRLPFTENHPPSDFCSNPKSSAKSEAFQEFEVTEQQHTSGTFLSIFPKTLTEMDHPLSQDENPPLTASAVSKPTIAGSVQQPVSQIANYAPTSEHLRHSCTNIIDPPLISIFSEPIVQNQPLLPHAQPDFHIVTSVQCPTNSTDNSGCSNVYWPPLSKQLLHTMDTSQLSCHHFLSTTVGRKFVSIWPKWSLSELPEKIFTTVEGASVSERGQCLRWNERFTPGDQDKAPQFLSMMCGKDDSILLVTTNSEAQIHRTVGICVTTVQLVKGKSIPPLRDKCGWRNWTALHWTVDPLGVSSRAFGLQSDDFQCPFSSPSLSTTVVIHSTRLLFGGLCILNLAIILFISGKTDLLTWSYELMELILKVYIYRDGRRPIFHNPHLTGIYASEGWFMKLMKENRQFVTRDPEKAHLFYLPYSARQLQAALYVVGSHNLSPLSIFLRDYVNKLAAKYPFWNRTHGSDHFLVACHDWGPYTMKGHEELMKNTIKALCNADLSEGVFKTGKDVSLPETTIKQPRRPLRNVGGGKRVSQRPILAFFAGHMHGRVRSILLKHWGGKDKDMRIYGPLPKRISTQMSYIQHMKSSKFCICPMGYEVNSPRIVEAVYFECIPVIIANNFVPPLDEVLNWSVFSVTVAEKDIPDLKEILLAISTRRYLKMLANLKMLQRHFLWNPRPVKYDMFHMILHSIWFDRLNQIQM